jgi:hypothetical protein
MKLRATILLALTALGLGLVVLVAPAEPARACSCVRDDRAGRWADLIVVGTITEVTDTAVRLAVESVEKGSLGAGTTLRLRVGRHEASCGYDFRAGTRYRVNSTDGGTGLCNGIRELPAMPSVPPTAPTPLAAAPGPSPGRWWPAAGALLIVLAAGLVAVALRRRRTG